jgi:hypothetical protein
MMRGDILSFSAWGCRVSLTTSAARHLASFHCQSVAKTATILEVERAQFPAFPAKKKLTDLRALFAMGPVLAHLRLMASELVAMC